MVFCRQHSTRKQFHRIIIGESSDSKKCYSALSMNITQTFDKVRHEKLMYKIRTSLTQNTYKLLLKLFNMSSFQIKSKDVISLCRKVSAVVTQGSILEPLYTYIVHVGHANESVDSYINIS